MDTPKYGAFSSSVDPQKLAATVEGLIATGVSGALFFGIFDATTATTLLNNVNTLVNDGLVLIPLAISMGGACYTLFGILRKAVVALTKKTSSQASVTVAT